MEDKIRTMAVKLSTLIRFRKQKDGTTYLQRTTDNEMLNILLDKLEALDGAHSSTPKGAIVNKPADGGDSIPGITDQPEKV